MSTNCPARGCPIHKFVPPIGADPRFIGGDKPPLRDTGFEDSVDAVRYALGGFTAALKREVSVSVGGSKVTTLGSTRPADRSSIYIGAELAGAKQRVKTLEAELSHALHEEHGRAIMMTCPDGQRHKWVCKEFRTETHYEPFPMHRRKGKYACTRCTATATIE